MTFRNFATTLVLASSLGGLVLAPVSANAQSLRDVLQHRQHTKNDWRNLATLGGGVAAIGLLTHDNLLTGLGIAGGLYSLSRYESDRKSQGKLQRRRAAYFSHTTITRNGHRYKRVIVTRSGHKYYAYKRA
jgi:hypothetical protein